MENLLSPEVIAGVCLALYFFIRGFHSFASKSGFGFNSNSSARDREALDYAKEQAIINRQEFNDLKRLLTELHRRIEIWDDMIHRGDFTCKWTTEAAALASDRIRRIEKMLELFR